MKPMRWGCAGFSFLCGQYDEGRKEQAFEQLLKSTRQLCGYAGEKGNMPICCEVFDYDIDKRALIGPATLFARYAGKSGGTMGISACWWI